MTFEPEQVRAFEHAGWQQAAAEYDGTFAQATRAFAAALLDAAAVAPQMRVLDLCCGTGVVTAVAASRGATPTGFDFSSAMLAEARVAAPGCRFDEGDAEALPYPDASFDAAVANFGIHHIPRPERAVGEIHRVLRPGSRVAFTAWAVPAENIAWKLLFDAIRAHGDLDAAKAPPSGGNLGTPEAALRLLRAAGFMDARAEPLQREWHLSSGAALVVALSRGTVRTAALIAAQANTVLPAVEATIQSAMTPYRSAGEFDVPIVAILASATKSPG